MTDTATARRGPAAVPCEYRSAQGENCIALIPDTDDARRTHRAWHDHDRRVHDGMRKTIADRDRIIDRLAGRVDELEKRLDDFARDIDNIEIPEPVQPLQINEWGDDDEVDEATTGYDDPDPAPTTNPDPFGYQPGGVGVYYTSPGIAIDRDDVDPATGVAR